MNVMELLSDKDFLTSLYGFAYKRVSNSYEAEDLCSDIIISVISAVRKNSDIANPYAFVWAIARRVYADFSEKRRISANANTEFSDNVINTRSDCIGEFIENENDKLQFRRIIREISFLSKIYRDVCVMYYLDEMKVADISSRLEISENTVKQRLYYARETIKKGFEKMENLTLQPMDIAYFGTGSPMGNDPRVVAERSFSKNLVYLCKDTERSVKELSELLGVPMPFVEEEVYIQEHGSNGYYGLLRKTDSGKYISNFILIDCDDYMKVSEMYRKNTDIIAQKFATFLKEKRQEILAMPFLNKQDDTRLIAWPLIQNVSWGFIESVEKRVEEKYFSNIEPTKRNFFTFGIAFKPGQNLDNIFYGCDGISGNDIGGYKEVYMSNMYGRRLQRHFSCGHNISQDPLILLTIRAIKGLPLSSLSEDEKEVAAKAIEVGYIKKENDILIPKILVSESKQMYMDILEDFFKDIGDLVEPVADEIYGFIKKYVPKHLRGEYKLFIQQTSVGLLDGMIQKCIELNSLVLPDFVPGDSRKWPFEGGVIMVVKK